MTKNKLTNLPVEERIKAYEIAIRLKKQNLRPIEIVNKLRQYNFHVNYDTILTWIQGLRNPKRKLNVVRRFGKKFVNLLGLALGDATYYKIIRNGSYLRGRLVFAVKDKELAKKFSILASSVLGKKKMYSVNWSKALKLYVVDIYSKCLVEILQKPIAELRTYIEKYPTEFLKGLFDAEGSVSISRRSYGIYPRIFLTNSNYELILLSQHLLKELGIRSTIQKNTPAWKRKIIGKKETITRHVVYNLSIENLQGIKSFAKLVNFTIYRKRNKLETALDLIKN